MATPAQIASELQKRLFKNSNFLIEHIRVRPALDCPSNSGSSETSNFIATMTHSEKPGVMVDAEITLELICGNRKSWHKQIIADLRKQVASVNIYEGVHPNG